VATWNSRTWTLIVAAAVLGFVFRNPLTLAVLHHETAPRPEVAGEPVQAADDVKPFEHVAGGKRYRIVPRFRWDESARVMSEEPYSAGAAGALIPLWEIEGYA